MKTEKTFISIGLPSLVFAIFLTLKLAEIGQVAYWSWWWVTSPLWIPAALVVFVLLIVLVAYLVVRPKNKLANWICYEQELENRRLKNATENKQPLKTSRFQQRLDEMESKRSAKRP